MGPNRAQRRERVRHDHIIEYDKARKIGEVMHNGLWLRAYCHSRGFGHHQLPGNTWRCGAWT